jgi:hypothetical protein
VSAAQTAGQHRPKSNINIAAVCGLCCPLLGITYPFLAEKRREPILPAALSKLCANTRSLFLNQGIRV